MVFGSSVMPAELVSIPLFVLRLGITEYPLLKFNMADNNVVKSTRGENKFEHNDFLYTRKKTSATTVYWVCADINKYRCKGTLKTALLSEHPQVRKYFKTTIF